MKELYSIRDIKVNIYIRLIEETHVQNVFRSISEVLSDPKTTLSKYPSDYELYKMGTFDDKTGVITTPEKPTFIINISDLVKVQAQTPQQSTIPWGDK